LIVVKRIEGRRILERDNERLEFEGKDMKILLAVDGSTHTQRLIDYLSAHAEWGRGDHAYTVMHCVAAVPPGAASMLSAQDLKAYYDEQADNVFAPIRAKLEQKGIKGEYVAKVGHAGDLIARAAESGGYDLVMMGSHGHGALGKLVLGSVATRVMAQCQVPVLLVR
jgi:nucleotide-binding universal stress UspA family protein